MQDTINIARNDSESLRVMVFNSICLFLPCNLLERIMRVRNNLVTFSKIGFFVFKHIITDRHDHCFVKIRPSREDPLANMLSCERFGSSPLALGGRDGDYHTLISRIGLEDADAVVAECTIVGQCMERWETSKSTCADTDTLDQAED